VTEFTNRRPKLPVATDAQTAPVPAGLPVAPLIE
jgi:hypothetical protein